MHILYVANARIPTEKAHGAQIMKMCEAFARLGHDVMLVIPWRFNPIKEDPFEYYGVERLFTIKKLPSIDLVDFGKIGFLIQTFSFAKFAFLYSLFVKTDMVFSRDEIPLFYLSLIKKNVIYEAHTGTNNFITRFLLRKKNIYIVAISQGLKEYLQKIGCKKEILVAHDGVDVKQFDVRISKEEVRKSLGIPLEKKIVMYIGRLGMWKGVETLLEASKLLTPDLNIQIVVIGGYEREIEPLQEQYPNVLFLGSRPYKDLAFNQQAADVLVLPNTGKDIISEKFTSPLKLFSYMASGTPIIASDLPSIREVLSEENAFLVVPDNPKKLFDEILNTLKSNNAQNRAHNAKKDVNHYDWSNRAKLILNQHYNV